ncbi:unnamed protein product [Cercospora beticola]|nr:unnamed protein product [Cercospora beticola]
MLKSLYIALYLAVCASALEGTCGSSTRPGAGMETVCRAGATEQVCASVSN